MRYKIDDVTIIIKNGECTYLLPKKYDGKEFIIIKNNNKMLIKKLKENEKSNSIGN